MKTKWDLKYKERLKKHAAAEANERLEHVSSYFAGGIALDFACGLGGNSIFLANHGFHVHAYDISSVAIQFVEAEANKKGLPIEAVEADLTNYDKLPIAKEQYDLIVNTYYLDRRAIPLLQAAVKAKGYYFMETYFHAEVDDRKNISKEFKLLPQELLQLFRNWHILYYEEKDGRQTILAKK